MKRRATEREPNQNYDPKNSRKIRCAPEKKTLICSFALLLEEIQNNMLTLETKIRKSQ